MSAKRRNIQTTSAKLSRFRLEDPSIHRQTRSKKTHRMKEERNEASRIDEVSLDEYRIKEEHCEIEVENIKVEASESIEEAKDTKKEDRASFIKKEDDIEVNSFHHVDPADYPQFPYHAMYDALVDMRNVIQTPVDTQGCERIADTITPRLSQTNPRVYRFQLLISLMLSSQTKDEVNYSAMEALHRGLQAKDPAGLTLESMLTLSESEIDAYICKVGFHNRKATYIYRACRLLRDNFHGDVPKTLDELVSLPGVGPKMGHLVLQCAWNINSGIGVDVHLHRLAAMWKWTKNAKTPEQTRIQLEEWMPRRYWTEVNPLVVGFGQTVCVPRAPNCDVCTLAKVCPGVKRELLKPLTEKRLAVLRRQRGNLENLIHTPESVTPER